MERLTIGELSQASGLSPATIRRYGTAGVLPPTEVDPHSGYRYYSPSQVETAVLARTLRQLEVPLEEVRMILDEPDATSRMARLEEHWRHVADQVDRGRRERDHVARLFSGFQELIDSYEVSTRPLEEVGALLRRRIVRLLRGPRAHQDIGPRPHRSCRGGGQDGARGPGAALRLATGAPRRRQRRSTSRSGDLPAGERRARRRPAGRHLGRDGRAGSDTEFPQLRRRTARCPSGRGRRDAGCWVRRWRCSGSRTTSRSGG